MATCDSLPGQQDPEGFLGKFMNIEGNIHEVRDGDETHKFSAEAYEESVKRALVQLGHSPELVL